MKTALRHSRSLLLPAIILSLASFTFAATPPWDPDEKWGSKIAEFETQDQKSPPSPHSVLFVGSSSIRMWDLKESWPDLNALNRGFGGSTIADCIHFFDRIVLPYRPSAIVLYAGDNDVYRGLDAKGTYADYREFTGLVQRKLPGTPVIFLAIKPSIKRWDLWPVMNDANSRIQQHTWKHSHLFYANIAAPMLAHRSRAEDPPHAEWFIEDGLHLTTEGYARWKQVLDPLLTLAGARAPSR